MSAGVCFSQTQYEMNQEANKEYQQANKA